MNIKTIVKLCGVIDPKLQRDFNPTQTLSVLMHNRAIWWSWAVNPSTIKNLSDKCLIFKPNGRNFKGFVCVTLGWDDVYQVHFISNSYKLTKSVEGVYFDMLVDVIDSYIETR
jgi:hypothetical protein